MDNDLDFTFRLCLFSRPQHCSRRCLGMKHSHSAWSLSLRIIIPSHSTYLYNYYDWTYSCDISHNIMHMQVHLYRRHKHFHARISYSHHHAHFKIIMDVHFVCVINHSLAFMHTYTFTRTKRRQRYMHMHTDRQENTQDDGETHTCMSTCRYEMCTIIQACIHAHSVRKRIQLLHTHTLSSTHACSHTYSHSCTLMHTLMHTQTHLYH